jgi:HlyD family secretion protein
MVNSMLKSKKILIAVFCVILLLVSWLYLSGKNAKHSNFQTAQVEQGDLTVQVTATGALSALTTVKVGSQVSGVISRLYADFNSNVKKGQLLAELDPTTLQAVADQRKADLDKANVDLRNDELLHNRNKKLMAEKLIAQSDFDTSEANFLSAQVSVKQAEAALRQANVNVSYTKITSPVDGTVVDRAYDVGQTVAASFEAPTLFTIAQDLTKMQVLTSIDESDIGKIRVGEAANFTVDAFPDHKFEGKVSQVRLSAQIVSNVVTYPVMIDVGNEDMKLKPGMTANVTIPVQSFTDVLKVPNAAFRFRPDPSLIATVTPVSGSSSANSSGKQGGSRQKQADGQQSQPHWHRGQGGQQSQAWQHSAEKPEGSTMSTLYILTPDGKLQPLSIETLATDGSFTVIRSTKLNAGDAIVIGLATTKAMEATGGVNTRSRGTGSRGFR